MKKTETIILILIFLSFAWLTYPKIRSIYLLTFKYQEVQGKIISAEIKEIQQDVGDEHQDIVTAFIPSVKFEYEVNGKKYTGTNYRASTLGEDRVWAESIREKFPPESAAVIYYNPDNPERSFLSREIPKSTWSALFGLTFLLLIITASAFGKLPLSKTEEKGESPYEGFENLVKKP
jgi:hypothetical protein